MLSHSRPILSNARAYLVEYRESLKVLTNTIAHQICVRAWRQLFVGQTSLTERCEGVM